VADSGFIRGKAGKNNLVADGLVFKTGHEPDPDIATRDPADIHALIEAVSADSEERDAALKREVYAALGVLHYWIIRNESVGNNTDGLITMYELTDGEYQLIGHRLVSQLKEDQ